MYELFNLIYVAFETGTKSIFHSLTRPVRAMALAYLYVLTGKKVTEPMEWKDI